MRHAASLELATGDTIRLKWETQRQRLATILSIHPVCKRTKRRKSGESKRRSRGERYAQSSCHSGKITITARFKASEKKDE